MATAGYRPPAGGGYKPPAGYSAPNGGGYKPPGGYTPPNSGSKAPGSALNGTAQPPPLSIPTPPPATATSPSSNRGAGRMFSSKYNPLSSRGAKPKADSTNSPTSGQGLPQQPQPQANGTAYEPPAPGGAPAPYKLPEAGKPPKPQPAAKGAPPGGSPDASFKAGVSFGKKEPRNLMGMLRRAGQEIAGKPQAGVGKTVEGLTTKDFQGLWHLVALEGDWEAHLKVLRVPPDIAAMTKAVNFGLSSGKTRRPASVTIELNDDDTEMRMIQHPSTIVNQVKSHDDDEEDSKFKEKYEDERLKDITTALRIDGTEHLLKEDDESSQSMAIWEEATLLTAAPGDDMFRLPTSSRRWLRDENTMVLEMTCDKSTVRRVYTRDGHHMN